MPSETSTKGAGEPVPQPGDILRGTLLSDRIRFRPFDDRKVGKYRTSGTKNDARDANPAGARLSVVLSSAPAFPQRLKDDTRLSDTLWRYPQNQCSSCVVALPVRSHRLNFLLRCGNHRRVAFILKAPQG